jgi:hypothetical protein
MRVVSAHPTGQAAVAVVLLRVATQRLPRAVQVAQERLIQFREAQSLTQVVVAAGLLRLPVRVGQVAVRQVAQLQSAQTQRQTQAVAVVVVAIMA